LGSSPFISGTAKSRWRAIAIGFDLIFRDACLGRANDVEKRETRTPFEPAQPFEELLGTRGGNT
jgi:hypothetical protein